MSVVIARARIMLIDKKINKIVEIQSLSSKFGDFF